MNDVVLIRKKGCVIGQEEFKDILTRYQGAFGLAIADGNEITVQKGKLSFASGVDAQVNSIFALQTDKDWSPEARFTAFFSGSSLSPESQQPFKLIGSDESPQIVAYLSAGDYSQHAEVNSLHSPAFHAVAKFLRPKLVELATRVDADIDKLFELLNQQETEDALVKGVFGPDQTGALAILLFDGRLVTIPCDKTPGISREWGWLSSVPVRVAAPALGNSGKPKLTLEGVTPSVPSKPKLEIAGETATVKTAEEINKTHGDARPVIWARPKVGLTNGVIKGLYSAFNKSRANSGHGFIPNDWKNRVLIQVDPKWLSHKDFINSMEVVDNPTPDQLLSSTGKKAVQTAKDFNVMGMLVMSAKQKQDFIEDLTMKGYINGASSRTADDIKKDEIPETSFFETAGFSLGELKNFSPASLAYLIKMHPEVALIALRNSLQTVPAAVASQPLPSSVPAAASSPGKRPRLVL